MKPYYEHAGITIYHGDCRDIFPMIPKVDLVLTDPPYGIGYEYSRANKTINYGKIAGDADAFDPSHLIRFSQVVLWGGNNFANRLPVGGWICWDKRLSEAADRMLGSPFELAWCSNPKLYKIVRLLHCGAKNADAPNGDVATEARFHPTQKPVRLMSACLSLFPNLELALDPYMGSGSTLRAAKDLGRRAIGIEIEERYCEIAARRLSQEVLQFA
jgi:DNA modification methylase